ncbi:MAG TPA: 2-isopropylmalate synthase [Clostridiales bacterium]|jgi:2-isopropylmalate synthase|nr:2-isopropylmalate synthase [Clostridiales bacterium]
MKQIQIFDTTLRDGEQSPGCSMNIKEKIEMARQLEALGVNVIEAGFAAASQGDFNAVRAVAKELQKTRITSLSRALTKDIDSTWEAIRYAKYPRIHLFIATSDIHMEYKLKKTRAEVLEQTAEMVRYAKKYCEDIEFSAEDATRSDPDFLAQVCEVAIAEGATVLNIPDTVGYTSPEEYGNLFRFLRGSVKGAANVQFSSHCHDDLGLAVANALAAIKAGAEQVECTINGIGERAGNTALEEIVMNLKTRSDYYGADTSVATTQIYKASRLLSTITGVKVQPNKAIVGENAFAHESGIHQHGMLANKQTYEIMSPESVGLTTNKMVLGKHSGRHAFNDRIKELGYNVDLDMINTLFKRFKDLADKKKTVSDRDIEALVRSILAQEIPKSFALERYVINSGNTITPTSSIALTGVDGARSEKVAIGFGPVDASFNAINKIVGRAVKLEEYSIGAVTEGRDAQGEVSVKITSEGATAKGYGLSTDVIEASILAYINAINNLIYETKREEQ